MEAKTITIITWMPNETKKVTIDLTQKITIKPSKFPVFYKEKTGEQKQFFPNQTVYTTTDGSKIYANSYLSADITQIIMNDKSILAGKKTITLEITRTGVGKETRYTVKAEE